jgi:hypothetical protein
MSAMGKDPDPWPTDAVRATAVVAVLVCELGEADEEYRESVLTDFVRTAWPTQRALRQ